MYFHSSPLLSSSLHPSFPLTLPLHLLYTPVLYTPPLFSSLAHPCGCAFEGSISNTSKGFLAVAACFSLFVYICTCMRYRSTIHVPSYLPSLICGACYSERTLSCYLFVGSYSPEEAIIPLSTIQGSECTNPSAQCPLCILMVPAYAQEAVAVSSLIMPVGCFQSFPLPASHALCVYISSCHLLSCCRSQSLSLFVPASFVPPMRAHASETQKHSERG